MGKRGGGGRLDETMGRGEDRRYRRRQLNFFVCFTGREAEKQRRRIERARSQLHGMDVLLGTRGSRVAAE